MTSEIIIVLEGELAKESGPWVLPEYRRTFTVPEPKYECDKFKIYWFKKFGDSEDLTFHAPKLHYISIFQLSSERTKIRIIERKDGKAILSIGLDNGVVEVLPATYPFIEIKDTGDVFITEETILDEENEYKHFEITVKKLSLSTGKLITLQQFDDVLD